MLVGFFVWLAAWSVHAVAQEDVVGTATSECPCIDPWGARACDSTCEGTNNSCWISDASEGYAGVCSLRLVYGILPRSRVFLCLTLDLCFHGMLVFLTRRERTQGVARVQGSKLWCLALRGLGLHPLGRPVLRATVVLRRS
eukprot:911412-Prorocentrum_minimum.AAC.1